MEWGREGRRALGKGGKEGSGEGREGGPWGREGRRALGTAYVYGERGSRGRKMWGRAGTTRSTPLQLLHHTLSPPHGLTSPTLCVQMSSKEGQAYCTRRVDHLKENLVAVQAVRGEME